MGNIDIKKVIIAIILVLIIGIGSFLGIRALTSNVGKYEIEEIKESDYKYFAVFSEGKYGVLNEKGELIVDNKYDDVIIPNPTKPVFICKMEDGTKQILNDKKEKLFTEYDSVGVIQTDGVTSNLPYEKSVLKYEKSGKFGLIDFEGKVITKPIYEELASVKYKEGQILAKKDGNYGVISAQGKQVIPCEYQEIEGDKYYNGNYGKSGYIVKLENNNDYQYGYINYKGKKLLKPEYTSITRLTDFEGEDIYLSVAKNGQYALMKNKNAETEFAYQSIVYNKDTNTLTVQRNDKYGVINLKRRYNYSNTI